MARSAAMPLDELRERVRELEGSCVRVQRVPTGVDAIDGLVGGLPVPGILELCGPVGSGRTTVGARLAAAMQGRGPVAWVDFGRRLYPPAAVELGVDPARLLVLRPAADRAAWAAEQVVRAGCFPLVVLEQPPAIGAAAGARWARAVESGGCAVVVLAERPSRDLPAQVRLMLGRGELVVVRDRGGRTGIAAPLAREEPWALAG